MLVCFCALGDVVSFLSTCSSSSSAMPEIEDNGKQITRSGLHVRMISKLISVPIRFLAY